MYVSDKYTYFSNDIRLMAFAYIRLQRKDRYQGEPNTMPDNLQLIEG